MESFGSGSDVGVSCDLPRAKKLLAKLVQVGVASLVKPLLSIDGNGVELEKLNKIA